MTSKEITSSKVLVLGMGTLGCNVTQTLLGWGIQYFTLVDNGLVSANNPARQSWYRITDIGLKKVDVSSQRIKETSTSKRVQCTGYALTIPMPGHPVHDLEKEDIKTLIELIRDHNVIFL